MKLQTIVITLALAMAGTAQAAGGKHDHKPLHGGVVVEGKELDFELVAKPTTLHLYLRDHGTPVDMTKAAAKMTLLSGNEKQEVTEARRQQTRSHRQLQSWPRHQGSRGDYRGRKISDCAVLVEVSFSIR